MPLPPHVLASFPPPPPHQALVLLGQSSGPGGALWLRCVGMCVCVVVVVADIVVWVGGGLLWLVSPRAPSPPLQELVLLLPPPSPQESRLPPPSPQATRSVVCVF